MSHTYIYIYIHMIHMIHIYIYIYNTYMIIIIRGSPSVPRGLMVGGTIYLPFSIILYLYIKAPSALYDITSICHLLFDYRYLPLHLFAIYSIKPGRIKPGRIKRAALSLQNQFANLAFGNSPV